MEENKPTTQPQEQENQAQENSFVDALMDGDGHSPSDGKDEVPDFGDQPVKEPEQKSEPEPPPPATADSGDGQEIDRLKSLLERVNKRLHDTQSRLHEECAKRADLQKELSDFQRKQEESDDWFSDEDNKRKQELEKQIAESDERLRQIGEESSTTQTEEAKEEWLAQANAEAKKHPDFDQKVYKDLGNLIDPQSKGFNPAVRQAWDNMQDKSPESAYKFAGEMLERLEAFNNPDAFKEKIRQDVLKNLGNDKPFGSEGLDMVNSANEGVQARTEPDGFVEALFK